jgi:hypothetical protein
LRGTCHAVIIVVVAATRGWAAGLARPQQASQHAAAATKTVRTASFYYF